MIKRIYNFLRESDRYENVSDIVDSLEIPKAKEPSVRAMMSRSLGVAKDIKHFGDGNYGIVGKKYAVEQDELKALIEENKMPWDN